MSYIEYLEQIEAVLVKKYGLTIQDSGIEFDNITDAQDAGWTAEEYVEWFSSKYNLIENDSHSNY